MITSSVLQGYVLEELLAKLLQSSGFTLLVDEKQDPAALTSGGNGLRVRGRGAEHQADVLGELDFRIPFTYPLRLFVEAKFKSRTIGLSDVRNALGVLNDVNEHYSWTRAAEAGASYKRFDYRYVLFSASGFSAEAQNYAITQRLSLVDLNEPAFVPLLEQVTRFTDAVLKLANSSQLDTFPVGQLREVMRRALGTWPLDTGDVGGGIPGAETRARSYTQRAGDLPIVDLSRIVAPLIEIGYRLYLGFTDAPFMLVVQADDALTFADFVTSAEGREVEAQVVFAGRSADTGEWAIVPDNAPTGTVLRLALPEALEAIVLSSRAAEQTENQQFSLGETIRIHVNGREISFRFASIVEPESAVATATSSRRQARLAPKLRSVREGESADGLWSVEAITTLMMQLAREALVQAWVIQRAALGGGSITRAEVYETGGYGPARTLRGFTRPVRRITQNLIDRGDVDENVQWPLVAKYDVGVTATRFVVPDEFVQYFLERE